MLGCRLKDLRNKKKLRQEDVANKLDIARTTYAMYEQDKREPDNKTLLKLARFFEVSTDYLLGLTDSPFQHITNSLKENSLSTDANDFNISFYDGFNNLSSEEQKAIKELITYTIDTFNRLRIERATKKN